MGQNRLKLFIGTAVGVSIVGYMLDMIPDRTGLLSGLVILDALIPNLSEKFNLASVGVVATYSIIVAFNKEIRNKIKKKLGQLPYRISK